jgi:translation initiation factor 2 subunit 3
VGYPGKLPDPQGRFAMKVTLLDRVVGAADDTAVEPIKVKEPLMLNVGTATTVGLVMKVGGEDVEVVLKLPVSVEAGSRVAISRRVGGRWRLIGFGVL